MDIPDHLRDDPVFARRGGVEVGRDGCRVPLPWEPAGTSLGFGSNGAWLPQPAHWADLAAAVQQDDPASMLTLYRRALATRRTSPALRTSDMAWVQSAADVLHLRRPHGSGDVDVVVNLSGRPYGLPDGDVLASSHPVSDGLLPDDAAAWVRLS